MYSFYSVVVYAVVLLWWWLLCCSVQCRESKPTVEVGEVMVDRLGILSYGSSGDGPDDGPLM